MTKQTLEIWNRDFRRNIIESASPIIVAFTAPWSDKAEAMVPEVEGLAEQQDPDFDFIEVDIEQKPRLANEYDVYTVPLFLFFFKGNLIKRIGRPGSVSDLEEPFERVSRLVQLN